jgi:hypothetical protein
MSDDDLYEKLREAVRKQSQRPAQEIWDEMVQRGAIDEEGNVLLRMPQPPTPAKKTKKKRKKSSDAKDEN